MSTILILDIVGFSFYFQYGETLAKARTAFKKLSGRYPSRKARILSFSGEEKLLDEITVNDLGQVRWPKGVVQITIN